MSTGDGKSTEKENTKGWSVPIWAAVITGTATIVVALIGLVGTALGLWVNKEPTNTPSPVADVVPTLTATIIALDTQMPESIIAEPTLLTSPTSEIPKGVMYVVLTANQTRGRNPLRVIFDARDSYFVAPDGTIFKCGACTYTWSIRMGGTKVYGPENTDGRLEYTFGNKGSYFVSVYVCRSGSDIDCGGSGAEIVVE